MLVKLTPVLVLNGEPAMILAQTMPHLAVEGRLLLRCQNNVGRMLRRALDLDGARLAARYRAPNAGDRLDRYNAPLLH
eukprot:11218931-Lingulodinium_polyedra.AAC.1